MAVLFDFNGTLVFDTPIQVRAWDLTSRARYGRGVTAEEYASRLSGLDNVSTAPLLAGRPVSPEEAEACSREKESRYFSICASDPSFRLVPGAEAFLDALAARGERFTIASSASEQNMDRYFALLSLSRWFSRGLVVCGSRSLPGKPEPAIFLEAMRRLEVRPEQTLIFEDSPAGLEAARRSGARAAAVAGTQSPQTLARLPGLAAVVSDFTQLPLLLGLLPGAQINTGDFK